MSLLRNSKAGYGWVAIALHWLMAVGVVFLFGLGLYMVELTYYDSWYRGSLDLHKSLGVVVLVTWALRLVWRWCNVEPAGLGRSWEQKTASVAHKLLYLLPLLLMLSGYLISTADGRDLVVFDWVSIPALPSLIEQQEDVAGVVHYWLAWSVISLAVVHALAAIKHHLIDKDGSLLRMLRPGA